MVGDELAVAWPEVTYAAVREADGAPVVLRTLADRYPELADVARLRREFDLTTRLAGVERVVHAHEVVEHGSGNIALVLEPAGTSIADRLEALGHAPLQLDEVLTIAIDVTRALGALHEADVVHQSVSPRSIVGDGRGGYALTNLGLASELANERQAATLSRRLEGSLPYVSPEQTGRMSRDVDHRSDFYSLGVTLFELLTGALPFDADQAVDWVYCHVCRSPPSPVELNPEVPATTAAIVLKLLAKDAEDRYQSAFGLIRDLERCREQLRATGVVADFAIGEHDVSRRFRLPQRLVGREHELSQLHGVFELVAAGGVELCLVTGDSGIGKTALVGELVRDLVREQGYLLQGKFEQFQSTAPYAALGSAFSGLVAQLLTEPPERVERARAAVLEALGPNGRLLVDVIPDLADVIGPQPPVPELPPTEARNRFHIVFSRFVRVFARSEHPLVLFLDDLQWSDAPTLELIRLVVTSRDLDHLLVIGSYRSGEIDAGHPLQLALGEIRAERDVEVISLEPLDQTSTRALVAETLHCTTDRAAELADLLHDTSGGNPFFVNEMLRTLHADGFVGFSAELGAWTWDVETVRRATVSDDVAEFMSASLRRLPENTRRTLVLAACIGSSFDLQTLSVIAQQPVDELADALLVALQRTLVVPLDDDYRFVGSATAAAGGDGAVAAEINAAYAFHHDRVQQAAYERMDADAKRVVHLRIGRLMVDDAGGDVPEDRLIAVVGHLNRGRELIDDPAERRSLADLNLRAGIHAKRSSAYQSALDYLAVGLDLLPNGAWSSDYELALHLHAEYQQCAYLQNRAEEAEEGIEILLRHARTNVEKAEVLSRRTRQYATLGRMGDSIEAAIAGLALLGIEFPANPKRADIELEVVSVERNLGSRSVEELLDAPRVTAPDVLVAIRLLMEIFPAAFLSGSGDLFPFLVLKSVNLSLEHGTSPETAFAYATFGMLLCGALDDPALGSRYGKLAVAMNEMLDDIALKSRVLYVYAMFVHHWNDHWSSMTPWFRRGLEAGYQSGDLLYLAYSAQDCIIWDPRLDLETASRQHREYLEIVADTGYQDSLDSGRLFLQLQLNMLGETDGPTSLSDAEFDEQACLAGIRARKFMTGVANYHIYKAEVSLLHGELDEALAHVRAQDELVASVMSLPQLVRFRIVAFLSYAAAYPSLDGDARRDADRRFDESLAEMRRWAANCPANFHHLALTMEAELHRLAGLVDRAAACYDAAVEAAHASGFLRDEAVANELAARCLLAAGRATAAEGYVRAAHHLFGRWGARRKTALLAAEFAGVLGRDGGRPDAAAQRAVDAASLDVESVIRASHAISGELIVDRLWQTTMPLVLQSAGGQRGCVIARRGGELVVEAEAVAEGLDGRRPPFSVQRGEGATLPMSIVDHVLRTNEPVVLNDPAQPGRFARDAYLTASPPQSLLCMSMSRGSRFEGAIYMEHHDATGVFTPDRVEIIRLLASQAMISLENAELYDDLLRLTDAQGRFVPSQFLESLGQHDLTKVGLGVHVAKEMTVLFADLRGFTPIAEHLHPREVMVLLNRYFEHMEPPIRAAGGFIDSYTGDEIMALFDGGADGAVQAATAMCRALERLNAERRALAEPELRVGIGVKTGPVLLGTVGTQARLKCGVVGDTVNAGSRIEQLTKTYGARLLVDGHALERLGGRGGYSLRELDRVAARGKTRAFDIHEVLDAEEDARRAAKEATRDLLGRLVASYRSRAFTEALALASLGHEQDPDDPVFPLYAARCERLLAQPPPDSWEGVTDL